MRQCDDLHTQCLPRRDASTTPTRLISVGLYSDDIKLCRSNEVSADAHYVALSHTWGKKEERKKAMPLLLSGNMSARMLGIPYDELTSTFKDAITIARNIGIAYIWIDSLCIVQDDREDWAKEAARMALVYKYAYLVIAATSSKNGDDGCLRRRIPSYDLSDPVNGSFHVQPLMYHRTIIEWQAGDDSMPLLDRAWCFQERLLARRVLHYTEQEMIWECQDELWCECQHSNIDYPPAMKLDGFKRAHAAAVASTDPEVRADSWDKFVRRYSELALTFGTDRLPGISGIAREIALPALGTYLAGLWEFQLPQALLWESTGEVIDRPPQYLAPTWSWASIVTAVVPFVTGAVVKSIDSVCRVIDIAYTPNTADVYGHVREGRLRISGPTTTATLQYRSRRRKAKHHGVISEFPNTEAPEKSVYITMNSDIELLEDNMTVVILFIHVRRYSTADTLAEGLALVQSKMHTGCWERIGVIDGGELDLSQMKQSEFVIV